MKSKYFFLGLLMVIMSSNSYGQFSFGVEGGFPTGNFSNFAKPGYGGALRYDEIVGDRWCWSASVGYVSFPGNTLIISGTAIPFGNSSIVPLSTGIKYYFSETNKGFYGAGDLGFFFISYYSYAYNLISGGYNTASSSEGKFGLTPGIGYRTGNWDFSGKINLISDASFYGLRVAYVFADQ